ncbi:hypothetical protein KCP76_22240 [Salmonella enterica subsp. enterica serovar Weltevreden]|nr:hypothetical protein KCP76_22240 [Salmonella enterica subsp. enterica serovar Weltevreden]
MTIFIMPSTFLRPERPVPTTNTADAPENTPRKSAGRSDSLIREKFHHKPANLAA